MNEKDNTELAWLIVAAVALLGGAQLWRVRGEPWVRTQLDELATRDLMQWAAWALLAVPVVLLAVSRIVRARRAKARASAQAA